MKKEKREVEIDLNKKFKYYIYTPNEIKENLPMLLFLHGIGERGTNLRDVEKYALPKYLINMDIPFIVIVPQCLDNNFWSYHLRDVEKILDIEHKRLKYNKERVCILGSSMGAFGAWNYIIQRPKLFKGIISASGGIMLPIDQNLELIIDKKILICHGDKDDIVDVSESLSAYEKLIECGAKNIELKIVKGANHFLCSRIFEDKYVFNWLEKNI